MRSITVAAHAGFCFGVTRAVNIAYDQIKKSSQNGENLYCLGSLIHNRDVTDELESMGMITVNSLDEVPEGSKILLRAHGEPDRTYEIAEKKKLEVIDATCPLVFKVHSIAKECDSGGMSLLVIGDAQHPEVQGILGSTRGKCFAAENAEAAFEIVEANPELSFCVVSQTTLIPEFFEQISAGLKDKFPGKVEIHNTVCPATKERQEAAAALARESDIMVLIGDETSSNYRKLRQICQKNCTKIVEHQKFCLQDIPINCKIGIAAGASTPERKIKEVIASMSETQNYQNEEIMDMAAVMEQIDKQNSLKLPQRNELVNGSVVLVNKEYVVINLGYKKDGMLPKTEINLEEGQTLTDIFHEGDEVSAKVIKTDDGDGNILLSAKRLQSGENWDELAAAMANDEIVEVTVTREVKGGVIANYKEVAGFIPMSQLADRYVESGADYIGKVLPVYVTRVDQKKNKAVFSHKAFLTRERDKVLAEVWSQIHVGDIVEGKVMRFTDYGAFVDIGGIDGLLHISEISWGKIRHPQEALEIGQVIDVKILSMNQDKGKISLGYKQNNPEPWAVIDDNYHVGDVVKGKVVQIKEYGAFIEIAPGLDGLVHISEISYKRVNKVADELELGQEVEAKILEIDKEKKRISLSMKQILPQPETPVEEETEPAEVAPEAAAEPAEVTEAPAEE